MPDNTSYLIATYGVTTIAIVLYMLRTFVQLKKIDRKLSDFEEEAKNES